MYVQNLLYLLCDYEKNKICPLLSSNLLKKIYCNFIPRFQYPIRKKFSVFKIFIVLILPKKIIILKLPTLRIRHANLIRLNYIKTPILVLIRLKSSVSSNSISSVTTRINIKFSIESYRQ